MFAIDMYCLGMIIYYITHTRTQRIWEEEIRGSATYLFEKLKNGEKPKLHFDTTLPERILTDVITTCWHNVATPMGHGISGCMCNPLVANGLHTPNTQDRITLQNLKCTQSTQLIKIHG